MQKGRKQGGMQQPGILKLNRPKREVDEICMAIFCVLLSLSPLQHRDFIQEHSNIFFCVSESFQRYAWLLYITYQLNKCVRHGLQPHGCTKS
jgi:hypothetical protein